MGLSLLSGAGGTDIVRGWRSGIFRAMNKLVSGDLDRVPFVHRLPAHDAFRNVAFTSGEARMRHRIKCSTVGTKERPAGGNWSGERHAAPPSTDPVCAATEGNSSAWETKSDRSEQSGSAVTPGALRLSGQRP